MAEAQLNIIVKLQDQASKGLSSMATSIGGVSKSLLSIGGVAAVGGIAAVGAGLGLAAKAGLGFNNSIEQASAKINAFTKDSGATAKILDMVTERASKTPFAFEEMAAAAAGLLPAARASGKGLEELISTAEILAAVNPAEGLEGAAFALREAASGDLTSVIERFNLPRQRLNELKAEGVPAIDAVRTAMQEMGFDADLVANMATTMEGRWSTFKDTLVGFAGIATEQLFTGLSSGLGSLQATLDANAPAIEAFAKAVGEGLGQALQWVAETAIPWLINDALPALQATFEAVWPAIQAAVSTAYEFLSGTVWPWLMGTAIPWLRDDALPGVQAAFETVWPAIAAAVAAVYDFLSGTVWPWLMDTAIPWLRDEALPGVQAAFEVVWPAIQTAVSTVYTFFKETVWPWLQGTAFPWLINTALPALQAAFEVVWPIIQSAVNAVYTFLKDIVWPWIKEAWDTTINQELPALQAAFETAWPIIQETISTVYIFMRDTVWPWIFQAFSNLKAWIEDVRGVWSTKIDQIKGILDDWQQKGEDVEKALGTVVDNIKGFFLNGWDAVESTVAGTWNSISSLISDPINAAQSAVELAIGAIKSVIQSGIDKVNALIDLINSIPAVPDIPNIPGGSGGGSGGGGGGFGVDQTPGRVGLAGVAMSVQSTSKAAVSAVNSVSKATVTAVTAASKASVDAVTTAVQAADRLVNPRILPDPPPARLVNPRILPGERPRFEDSPYARPPTPDNPMGWDFEDQPWENPRTPDNPEGWDRPRPKIDYEKLVRPYQKFFSEELPQKIREDFEKMAKAGRDWYATMLSTEHSMTDGWALLPGATARELGFKNEADRLRFAAEYNPGLDYSGGREIDPVTGKPVVIPTYGDPVVINMDLRGADSSVDARVRAMFPEIRQMINASIAQVAAGRR